MTTISKFNSRTKFISDNLNQTVNTLSEQYGLHPNSSFPPIGISFCTSQDDDSSDWTMQSYYSAYTAVYSINSAGEYVPPESTLVPIQTWSKPPTIIPAVISAVSTLTSMHQPSEQFT